MLLITPDYSETITGEYVITSSFYVSSWILFNWFEYLKLTSFI